MFMTTAYIVLAETYELSVVRGAQRAKNIQEVFSQDAQLLCRKY